MEVYALVTDKTVSYKGLIDVKQFIKMLDNFFKDRGYDKRETKNIEECYEDGKDITIEFFPHKTINDYAKMEIRIFMIFSKLQDVEVEKNDRKLVLQKGSVNISYDVMLVTDHEGKYNNSPLNFFFRQIFDKYLFKDQITQNKNQCLSDAEDCENEMKSFLNMMRYR